MAMVDYLDRRFRRKCQWMVLRKDQDGAGMLREYYHLSESSIFHTEERDEIVAQFERIRE